uniref:Uncharacterized protein n=1 Tax=Arundo donax TaxID=35708 RepID=A0A0A9FQ02_ARUDO
MFGAWCKEKVACLIPLFCKSFLVYLISILYIKRVQEHWKLKEEEIHKLKKEVCIIIFSCTNLWKKQVCIIYYRDRMLTCSVISADKCYETKD